jgi:hypothetical protein
MYEGDPSHFRLWPAAAARPVKPTMDLLYGAVSYIEMEKRASKKNKRF